MDEAWERAVEAALEGQAVDSSSPPRALTLDGAVKCLQGRLPPPGLLERYQSLEHLSIASVGVSSLVTFPRLRNLRRLILSDNRIAGGLEFLVEAGLDSLRDLDLSNNRIQFLEDLAPLARLRLVSLDLYECPVTRVRDYRTRVFAMIRSLKYLDKMDADENERPETDEEDDEEEEEEEEDPGSGEIDGEDRTGKVTNGVVGTTFADGIVGVDGDDESDADEEVETVRTEANGLARGFHHHHLSNGFRVAAVGEEDEEEVEEDVEYDDVDGDDANEDLAEEIDEDDGEDEGVVEVHDIAESDEDVDEMEEEEIEEQDGDEVDGDGEEDEEDVDDEEEDAEPGRTARMTSTDGEIDGHDQGEEDENGEIGEEDEERAEEELNFEEDDEGEDEEEDLGGNYLLQQHVDQVEVDAGGSDFDACNGEDENGVDDNDNAVVDDRRNNGPSSSSHPSKRKRDEEDDVNEDDCVKDSRSSKLR